MKYQTDMGQSVTDLELRPSLFTAKHISSVISRAQLQSTEPTVESEWKGLKVSRFLWGYW